MGYAKSMEIIDYYQRHGEDATEEKYSKDPEVTWTDDVQGNLAIDANCFMPIKGDASDMPWDIYRCVHSER